MEVDNNSLSTFLCIGAGWTFVCRLLCFYLNNKIKEHFGLILEELALDETGETFKGNCLSLEQELLEEELLQQKFLEDLLIVGRVEVVDWISNDWFIDGDGGYVGDGQEHEQCLSKEKEMVISSLISWHLSGVAIIDIFAAPSSTVIANLKMFHLLNDWRSRPRLLKVAQARIPN